MVGGSVNADCHDARVILEKAVTGETVQGWEDAQEHLKKCAACAERHGGLLEIVLLARSAGMEPLPEGFDRRFEEKLAGFQTRRRADGRMSGRLMPHEETLRAAGGPVAAMASMLLVLAGLAMILPGGENGVDAALTDLQSAGSTALFAAALLGIAHMLSRTAEWPWIYGREGREK